MQNTKGIRWGLLAAMLVLALSLFAACANRVSPNRSSGTHVVEGYIVDYDGSSITIDEVELLTTSSTKRINELGLDKTRDFRNGYYVHDDGRTNPKTYSISPSVQVAFADTNGNTANGVNRGTNVNMDTANALTWDGGGTANPTSHMGYTLGGSLIGTVGNADMLGNRYRTGLSSYNKIPYFITIKDGYVTHIEEVRAFSNFAGNDYTDTSMYPSNNYPYDGLYPTTNDNLTTKDNPDTYKYPSTNNVVR